MFDGDILTAESGKTHFTPKGLVGKESKNKLPTDFDVNFSKLVFTNTIHVKLLVDYDDIRSR